MDEPGVGDDESDESDDCADRRSADAALVDRLRAAGFAGEEYEQVQRQLVALGVGSLHQWICDGSIYERCRRRRHSLGGSVSERRRLADSQHDRDDVVEGTVAVALEKFRQKALIEGRWRPDGGASLATYFTTGVILQFSNQFKKWCREQRRLEKERRAAEESSDPRQASSDPGDFVVQKADVLARIYSLTADHREVVALYYDGYSVSEIARLTRRSKRSVEGLIRRWKEKNRDGLQRGQGE